MAPRRQAEKMGCHRICVRPEEGCPVRPESNFPLKPLLAERCKPCQDGRYPLRGNSVGECLAVSVFAFRYRLGKHRFWVQNETIWEVGSPSGDFLKENLAKRINSGDGREQSLRRAR